MNIQEIIEKIETIASATMKNGEINRKKADRIIDPHHFFHNFINEDEVIDPLDAEYADFKKLEKIKAKIYSMIKYAFNKCNIAIDEDEIYYDEDNNEVSVTLDEIEINTNSLNLLEKSGLANDYIINAYSNPLRLKIEFSFNKSLL